MTKYSAKYPSGGQISRTCGKEHENSNLNDLAILNPETWKHPRPDLLIESELEAFNGWYGVMINPSPKYGEIALSHEEATQLAWKFILDSMKNQHREGRGRYASKSKEMKK